MSEELMPCPFCGQQDAFVEQLGRQACPNARMVIAYEATVTALSATPSPETDK